MNIQSRLVIRDTDPLVSEHRVHDIHILPGVSMLDAIYKTLASAKIQMSQVELSDIVFHEPVVTHDQMDRKLTVNIELDDKIGTVKVTSIPWQNEQTLSEQSTIHLTCHLSRGPINLPLPLEVPDFADSEDLDSCYQVTRHVGIFHESFMKCQGRVCTLASGDIVGQIQLSQEATAYSDDFILHPVILDCATIVPLFNLQNRLDESSLFIPFSIKKFFGQSLTGKSEVLIRVRQPDGDITNREILSHRFEIYDLDGTPLACFDQFSVKRVRNLKNMRQLLSSGLSAKTESIAHLDHGQHTLTVLDTALQWVIDHVSQKTDLDWLPEYVDTSFFELELDSLDLLEVSESIARDLGVQLYPTVLFEHSTVTSFTDYLKSEFGEQLSAQIAGQITAKTPQKIDQINVANQDSTESKITVTKSITAQQESLSMLEPRWQSIYMPRESVDSLVAIWNGNTSSKLSQHLSQQLGDMALSYSADFSTDSIKGLFQVNPSIAAIWLIQPDHHELFKLIQALIQSGRLIKPLEIRVFTQNAFRVSDEPVDVGAGHGNWGLLQTFSREYETVRVTQIDVSSEDLPALDALTELPWISELVQLTHSKKRMLLALRQGQFYQRQLFRCEPSHNGIPPLRRKGVYVVIGGAGGVGMALVRYLRQRFDASVAILGRREESELKSVLAEEPGYGKDLIYLSCSADNTDALAQAFDQIKKSFGAINGVIHSAMVLDDKLLVDMSRISFDQVLAPKVDGVQAIAQATDPLDLDFLVFFSSVQSFIGNSSQASYACASTYLDGYALALDTQRDYPVTVINWGFWKEVGAVATEMYRQLLTRQGMFGLETDKALQALMQSLSDGYPQTLIVAANDVVMEEMGLDQTQWLLRHDRPYSIPTRNDVANSNKKSFVGGIKAAKKTFNTTQQAMALLLPLVRQRVAGILHSLGIQDQNSLDDQLEKSVVTAHYKSLLHILIGILDSELTAGQTIGSHEAYLEQIKPLLQKQPVLNNFVPLLNACLEKYESVITGEQPALEVVFPGGSNELVEAVYAHNDISNFYNRLLASGVVARIKATEERASNNNPIRLLEVGAGTAASSFEIMQALNGAGIACEYWFTDLWGKLVEEARLRLESTFPQMRFRVLDIGIDPDMQGITERFDLVIATNVLHATPNLNNSLKHVKKLLLPGGTLLLNENVQLQEYSTFTFGLLPGWWNAVDSDQRIPGSPLATQSTWVRIMRDTGFFGIQSLVPDESSFSAQTVLVAQSDGIEWMPGTLPVQSLPECLHRQLVHLAPDQIFSTKIPVLRYLKLFCDEANNIWLFLNNPPANTFTYELLGELCNLLDVISAQPETVIGERLLYISHLDDYFSLGGDRAQLMLYLANQQHDAIGEFSAMAKRLMTAIVDVPILVVSVVNGTAQGGGLETLLATDLQLVRKNIKLGLPEIKSGLIPGMGGLTYLSHQIGNARFKRLVMSGELISAQEAYEAGIISHVVDDPYKAALDLASSIPNIKTALHIKQLMASQQKQQLTADIDSWQHYLLNKVHLIDSTRIESSTAVIQAMAGKKSVNNVTNTKEVLA